MRTNDHKLAQRQQIVFVTPAAAVLLAGIIYDRMAHGGQDALHYVAWIMPVLVAATLAGRLASARDLRRLTQLQQGAERLEAGQYETIEFDQRSDDEFSDLARAFNHMVEVLALRDATQRNQNHKLAELNRRMETVLDATNDGIALLDRNGCFALVNRRFCEMLGIEADSILGRTIVEIHANLREGLASFDRLIERVAPHLTGSSNHPAGVAEEVVEVITNERRFLQVYTAPVRDERRTMNGRIIALHDITRETELDRMKTDFIGVVSHELRTPLTSIKGYTDILLNEQAGEINGLQREFLSITQASASRLNNLINDILDISRLESGTVEVKTQSVNYEALIADSLRMMKTVAADKSITFESDFPENVPAVRGDADKIVQIVTNLLSNAIKYTPVGGTVTISLEVSGASVTTCVKDNGIGISPDDQKKLFQKFFRADNSTTREAGGTGLGLVIVKSTVELLGGAVWVESEMGEGSKFYFTLPVYSELSLSEKCAAGARSDIELAAPASEPERSVEPVQLGLLGQIDPEHQPFSLKIEGPRSHPIGRRLIERGLGLVMIVATDNPLRAQLHHTLHRMGYGVITAKDPDAALDRARVHRPDVILLDLMVAKRENNPYGLGILQDLQSDPAAQSLPLVAYTLSSGTTETECAVGAVSFAKTHFTATELAQRIRSGFAHASTISVLGVCPGASVSAFEELAPYLLEYNFVTNAVDSPTSAVALAKQNPPDILLLDGASHEPAIPFGPAGERPQEVAELIVRFKSDPCLAPIPFMVTVAPYSASLDHLHIGPRMLTTHTAAFDYLADQVAKVMVQRGLGPSGVQLAA